VEINYLEAEPQKYSPKIFIYNLCICGKDSKQSFEELNLKRLKGVLVFKKIEANELILHYM
jgi:hypothetical protein